MTVQISAEMEKDYGICKKRYSYKENFELSATFTAMNAADVCDAHLEQMFEDFESVELPRMKATSREPEMRNDNGELWQTGLKFVKNVKGGKVSYSLITPKYRKFGVAVYPECKGFQTMIDQLGEHFELDLDGCSARIDTTGKYPKAVEITLQDVPF